MIKVISGKYKGQKLNHFNLKTLRPTQAKIRKSMMDTLMPLENKKILDLFSGAGSLGIEAISRGAKSVCFVDNNPRAISILKKNLNMLNLKDNVKIKLSDGFRFLKKTENRFDIVIAAPPYYNYKFEDLLDLVKPKLIDDGIFCFESHKTKVDDYIDAKIKIFGNTQLIYWSKK